jgi:hypothetical protein
MNLMQESVKRIRKSTFPFCVQGDNFGHTNLEASEVRLTLQVSDIIILN